VYAFLSAQQPRTREHDVRWIAPPSEAARTTPLAGRSDVIDGGQKLFHERCSSCHGGDARGQADAPDLSSDEVQKHSDGELFWTITSGNTRSGMPTFSFLPPLQRWQLVLYMRSQIDRSQIDRPCVTRQ